MEHLAGLRGTGERLTLRQTSGVVVTVVGVAVAFADRAVGPPASSLALLGDLLLLVTAALGADSLPWPGDAHDPRPRGVAPCDL